MIGSITPKIFYQTWKTSSLPEDFAKNRKLWLDILGPEWSTPLIEDSHLRDVIAKVVPEHLSTFDSLTEKIEKVDFIRYALMYQGGVYADLDTYPTRSISRWIGDKVVLGREPLEHSRDLYSREIVLCNAFMISPPKQRLWLDLMDFIAATYEPHYKPVYNTGPMAMTRFLERSPSSFDGVIITDPCVFFPMKGDGHISTRCNLDRDSYVVHVWKNTWVSNPFTDPRWKNKRYWLWVTSLILVCLFLYYLIR